MARLGASWQYLLIGIVSAVMLTLVFDRVSHTALPERLVTLGEAERSSAPGGEPPPPQAAWVPVSLPDNAPVDSHMERQQAWYRLRFELPEEAPPLWGLMLQRPLAATKIWVNGVLLADSGVDRRALPEYRHELRYNLAAGLLVPGENTLIILTRARIHSAGLSTVWLGDAAQMAQYKAARNRIEKRWPELAVRMIGLLALIVFGFFLVRRQDSAFGWFAAALACWALHTALDQGNTPPALPSWTYQPLILIGLIWFVVFGLRFVLCLQAQADPVLERRALWFGSIASLLALAASASGIDGAYRYLTLVVIVPGVLLLGGLISLRLWQASQLSASRRESGWLLALSSTLLVIGIRDWLLDARLIGDWQSVRYLPFAAPMVFLVFGALLLRRYARALTEAEQLNRRLEDKVAEKTADIERYWRQIAQIDRERGRFEERDRLMREMHDGVGGHLVQALALSEQASPAERVRESVQTALDDLRLWIDASDVHAERLNDPLARLRERMSRRLAALGIELRWDFTQMPELPRLTPSRTAQVLRILQEAITNVIKHASASQICIACECILDPATRAPAQILLEVADDGVGFEPEQVQGGRGLTNLRNRVAALKGKLAIHSRPAHGTRLRLQVPVLEGEG